MKSIKSEKGAVTLLVLVTILFFVAFLITTYMIMANKAKSQKEVTDQTSQIYNSVSAEQAYNSYFGDNVVPIYTVDQLLKIGSGDSIQINEAGGKIYTFSKDATYVLMNNLQFEYRDSNNWTPIGTQYEIQGLTGRFEGNGKTITVSGNIVWGSPYEFNMGNGYKYVNADTDKNLINIAPDTMAWTNGNVMVTITTTAVGYTLQYSTDGTTWLPYTDSITMTANGTISASLYDGTNNTNPQSLYIGNIDKVPPTVAAPTITNNTTSGFTVNFAGADKGGSGLASYIIEYKQSTDSTYTAVTVATTATSGTQAITGLTDGTIYNVRIKAADAAENVSEYSSVVDAGVGYVQSGLVLCYDGINNAGTSTASSHSTTTTTWKDLTGNGHNGTLTGFNNTAASGWNGNALVFDGVNDKVDASISLNYNTGITVECKYTNQNTASAFVWVLYTDAVTSYKLGGGYRDTNIYYFTNSTGGSSNNSTIAINNYMPINSNATVAVTEIPGQKRVGIYVNGIKNVDNVLSLSLSNITSNKLSFGIWSTYYAKTTMYAFRIYNRTLTDAEILQNYYVDQYRFGL